MHAPRPRHGGCWGPKGCLQSVCVRLHNLKCLVCGSQIRCVKLHKLERNHSLTTASARDAAELTRAFGCAYSAAAMAGAPLCAANACCRGRALSLPLASHAADRGVHDPATGSGSTTAEPAISPGAWAARSQARPRKRGMRCVAATRRTRNSAMVTGTIAERLTPSPPVSLKLNAKLPSAR